MSKRVIISACLLGEYYRYDGKTKAASNVIEAFKEYEIIPFCPEAPLFGTPRQRINLLEIAEDVRVVTDETAADVTKLLEAEINAFIKKYPQVDAIVLKSKSPSCGIGTTPILDSKKNLLHYGDGVAAKIFKEKYKKSLIRDENL